jgi:hypothetical protein
MNRCKKHAIAEDESSRWLDSFRNTKPDACFHHQGTLSYSTLSRTVKIERYPDIVSGYGSKNDAFFAIRT